MSSSITNVKCIVDVNLEVVMGVLLLIIMAFFHYRGFVCLEQMAVPQDSLIAV